MYLINKEENRISKIEHKTFSELKYDVKLKLILIFFVILVSFDLSADDRCPYGKWLLNTVKYNDDKIVHIYESKSLTYQPTLFFGIDDVKKVDIENDCIISFYDDTTRCKLLFNYKEIPCRVEKSVLYFDDKKLNKSVVDYGDEPFLFSGFFKDSIKFQIVENKLIISGKKIELVLKRDSIINKEIMQEAVLAKSLFDHRLVGRWELKKIDIGTKTLKKRKK